MKGIINILYLALMCIATIGGAGYAIMANANMIAFACILLAVLIVGDYFGWLKTPKWPK